jgi:hypothetical protein
MLTVLVYVFIIQKYTGVSTLKTPNSLQLENSMVSHHHLHVVHASGNSLNHQGRSTGISQEKEQD